MFPDLIGATRDYWRKLDAVEAAYRRSELTLAELDTEVKALMVDLGQTRRKALRDVWATVQVFLQQQRETISGVAVIGVLAYAWLTLNGPA